MVQNFEPKNDLKKAKFAFLGRFRSERAVSTIFPPYVMPNGTYERIKNFYDTLPLTSCFGSSSCLCILSQIRHWWQLSTRQNRAMLTEIVKNLDTGAHLPRVKLSKQVSFLWQTMVKSFISFRSMPYIIVQSWSTAKWLPVPSKIPSEVEVAPRYMLLNTPLTMLHCWH